MKTFVGLNGLEPPAGGSAVTAGTFDGVHIGHRALIARTVERARELEAAATAITWDRHPNVTLRPERVPPLLTSQARKIELLSETELDVVLVLPFDEALAHWAPERFVAAVLAQALGARAVIAGGNWRFGHRASGDVGLLRRLGPDMGFEVDVAPVAEVQGAPVSSSRAREAVAAGDISLARSLLGRPFDLDGVVIRGDARGAALGYPTANLLPDPALVRPPRGVYAGRARARGTWHKAAVNVGVNPTFGGSPEVTPIRVEAYLLDFSGELYGQSLRIEFWKRLREEQAFDSVDALVAQIDDDVAIVRDLVEG